MLKKFKKNLNFIAQGVPKTQSTIIWLIGILRVKSCIAGVHVQSEMNALGTFGDHGMGGGDTTASLSHTVIGFKTFPAYTVLKFTE